MWLRNSGMQVPHSLFQHKVKSSSCESRLLIKCHSRRSWDGQGCMFKTVVDNPSYFPLPRHHRYVGDHLSPHIPPEVSKSDSFLFRIIQDKYFGCWTLLSSPQSRWRFSHKWHEHMIMKKVKLMIFCHLKNVGHPRQELQPSWFGKPCVVKSGRL